MSWSRFVCPIRKAANVAAHATADMTANVAHSIAGVFDGTSAASARFWGVCIFNVANAKIRTANWASRNGAA